MILPGCLYLGDWADAQQHDRLKEISIKRCAGGLFQGGQSQRLVVPKPITEGWTVCMQQPTTQLLRPLGYIFCCGPQVQALTPFHNSVPQVFHR